MYTACMQEDVLWKAANANARDIVLRLLERDPAKRLTAADALLHPWLAADLRASRQVAAGADIAGVLPTKRARLQTEAKQAHVEDFMKLMSMVRRHRTQCRTRTQKSGSSSQVPKA